MAAASYSDFPLAGAEKTAEALIVNDEQGLVK
jgi:hypothetical protein